MKTNNVKIVRELTPELADKIFDSFRRTRDERQASKALVLHNLKQCKAQMGKLKSKKTAHVFTIDAIKDCMEIIDKKIAKIKSEY